jgi:chemotaxis receptor (MCP) glutamine deamidase CheD
MVQNIEVAKDMLCEEEILSIKKYVGGCRCRKVIFDMYTGMVALKRLLPLLQGEHG